uniref:Ig-like domain-containing protein n=1 Tax=Cynoglossus semilaevis TaxID=244447 RepID=A0A3P8VDT7_CYNSE
DAVPAASVSWLLPAGVSVVSWSNFTSHNGSYSVREVFLLPACSNSQTFPFLQGQINFTSCLCFRSDGVFVYTEGSAVVFQSGLTEEDQGLYTCRASFYHHGATVRIQVEVTSQDEQFGQGLLCTAHTAFFAVLWHPLVAIYFSMLICLKSCYHSDITNFWRL